MQLTRNDHRRRGLGLFLLVAGMTMTIWGATVLQPHLDGWGYLLFWCACISVLLLALGVAVLDMVLVGRRLRAERRALLQAWEQEIQGLRKRTPEAVPDAENAQPTSSSGQRWVTG